MAHANPEFVLGLMRPTTVPVSQQVERRSIASMRAYMMRLATIPDGERTEREQAEFTAWRRAVRQTQIIEGMQRATAQLHERGGGMHAGGKAGERFVEPKRRYPLDVQKHGV